VGAVEWLAGPARVPLPRQHEPLAALLKRLMDPLPPYQGVAPSFDDAGWVGGRLIELLPLALPLKQSLLELADPERRLEQLAALLERPPGE
jgi:Lon protease-like protein